MMRCPHLVRIALPIVVALSLEVEPVTADSRVYRGMLFEDHLQATGLYDLRFHLYEGPDQEFDHPLATVELYAVAVHTGRFEVTLDLPIASEGRWLGIEVAEANSGHFVPLSPPQLLGPEFESPRAVSASRGGDTIIEMVDGGNLVVSGKVVAGGFQLGQEVITSWSEIGGDGAKTRLVHRSAASGVGFPLMQIATPNAWFTGGSKSIDFDRPGQIWVLMTGRASGVENSSTYHAQVEVGIGIESGTTPVNEVGHLAVGGDQNLLTSWTVQHWVPVEGPGTLTFYAMARHVGGMVPVFVQPEGMTILFVPN